MKTYTTQEMMKMKTYTTQEMMKMKSSLGGWRNIALLGEAPAWIESYPPEKVDPNKETIFGYDAEQFLKRQYK